MQEVINKQNESLKAAEKIICEFKSIYRDYNKPGETYFNIEPIYDEHDSERAYIKIDGGYVLDQSYWASPEFNRIILRNFMILKSLFPKEKISLTIPELYRDKIHFNEDTLRILTTYQCKLNFSKNASKSLHQKLDNGNDVYSVRWSILKDNKIYFNFQTMSLISCGDDYKKVMFETRLESLISAKSIGAYYNSELVDNLCEGKVACRRLINSLFNLLCASDEVRLRCPHIINLEIKMASCLAIIENISEDDIRTILNEMALKMGLSDGMLVERVIAQILTYQESLLGLEVEDESNNLLYQAYKKLDILKKAKKQA